MTVAIVLVTHPGIGTAFRQQAAAILASDLPGLPVVELHSGKSAATGTLRSQLAALDQGDGVLMLSDLPGATPCNQACKAAPPHSALLSGLNLPMLIRAWNYRHRTLEELTELVAEGGRAAILEPR